MSASPSLVPYLSVSAFAGVAGVAKWRDPRLAIAAAREIGLGNAAPLAVRGLAFSEIALATAAWSGIAPVVVACAVAALYAGFAAVTLVLWRRGATVSCGCFGVRSVRPSTLHLALNGGAFAAAALAIASPPQLFALATMPQEAAGALEAAVGAYLLFVLYTQSAPKERA